MKFTVYTNMGDLGDGIYLDVEVEHSIDMMGDDEFVLTKAVAGEYDITDFVVASFLSDTPLRSLIICEAMNRLEAEAEPQDYYYEAA